jgi:hypothetical protein
MFSEVEDDDSKKDGLLGTLLGGFIIIIVIIIMGPILLESSDYHSIHFNMRMNRTISPTIVCTS